MPEDQFASHKSQHLTIGDDDFLSHKSWTTADFVKRYASGSGRTADLRNIGLLNKFRNARSVRNAIREFELRQMRIAERNANNICGRNRDTKVVRASFSDNNTTVTDVTQDGALFSVGASTFFRTSRCKIEVDCSQRIIRLDGILTFEIRDVFKDPFDIGIELPKSKVFKIVAKWSQPMNFIFDRLRTGRWIPN